MIDESVKIGVNHIIQDNCIVGLRTGNQNENTTIGDNAVIRSGTIIYQGVIIGDSFQSGHNVLIREQTVIGDHVVVGTNSVVDGNTVLGSYIKIETNCYIPTNVSIGNRVFIGPNVTLTNDKYPLRMRESYEPTGPIIEDNVTLGAGSIVLPGVRIGEGSMIAAGAVVTEDIPAYSLVVGVPGKTRNLPEKLREKNTAISWRQYLDD